MTYDVAALYRFTPLEDIPALRQALQSFGQGLDIVGTILLAPEGINGTIAGRDGRLQEFLAELDGHTGVFSGEIKYSTSAARPFNRFKVRHKKEIITMRRPEANPALRVGAYVEADEWNALISDPDVVVIDTRNVYETAIGAFRNARDPGTQHFSEFPDFVAANLDPAKHKRIAMYCTGGIRCEKASSYMMAQGFENVYHLKGGILKYLEVVSQDQSLWDGECFVFDKRVSVGHGLKEGKHKVCFACRAPLQPDIMNHPSYEEGVSCPSCIGGLTPDRADMLRHRHRQLLETYENGDMIA